MTKYCLTGNGYSAELVYSISLVMTKPKCQYKVQFYSCCYIWDCMVHIKLVLSSPSKMHIIPPQAQLLHNMVPKCVIALPYIFKHIWDVNNINGICWYIMECLNISKNLKYYKVQFRLDPTPCQFSQCLIF